MSPLTHCTHLKLPTLRLSPQTLLPALLLCLLAAACTPPEKEDAASRLAQSQNPGTPSTLSNSLLSDDDQREVVAKIDQEVITLGEYERRLNAQAPFARARYNTIERKKDFLTNMVQFEALAQEARDRGYDKDPEVVLELKQAMVRKLMADEIDKRMGDVQFPDQDLRAYYDAHIEDYLQPAKVRASQILVADKDAALALVADLEAEFAKNPTKKRQIFALKARSISLDKPTAELGGDMRFFAHPKEGGTVNASIADAIFALPDIGNITPPVQTEAGWHVIMLTAKKQRYERPFDEVKRTIQNILYRERRVDVEQKLIDEIKKGAKIEVRDDLLAKLKDPEAPPGQPNPGHDHQDGPPNAEPPLNPADKNTPNIPLTPDAGTPQTPDAGALQTPDAGLPPK